MRTNFTYIVIKARGEWDESEVYRNANAVSRNGRSYFCFSPSSVVGTPPESDTDHWFLIAEKGNDGVDGVATWSAMSDEEKEDILSKLQTNLLGFYNGTGGFIVTDTDGNIALKYDSNGLDAALLSSHFKDLIKAIDGLGLALGITSSTAYAGNKGLSLENSIKKIQDIIKFLNQTNNEGFSLVDSLGNIALKYDSNGLDTALLSTHFNELINSLISIVISAAKGTTIAPLINSLIPAAYLPSYVDDVIDVDIWGSDAITEYCTENNGNTEILEDKLCYDDTNKVLIIAKQINNSINIETESTPESGKIYIDKSSNKTYRWSGTIMVPISNDMALGEIAGTAYAGDKGKQNADNIMIVTSLINKLSLAVSKITSMIKQSNEEGYNVTDEEGNIGMKYDSLGFDIAKLSTHFESLIKSIDGFGGNNISYTIIETL